MKKICFLGITLLALFSTQTLANELLVLSGTKSKNSKRWQEEVLPEYSKNDFGAKLPVKILPIQGNDFPGWFKKALEGGRVGRIIGTPTFIIWDLESKKELGRIEGYTQKSRFYSQLQEALLMVEKGLTPNKRESLGDSRRSEGSGRSMQKEGSSTNQDIMKHIYKSPEEAKKASEILGFEGKIHSHDTPNGKVYMPGASM